MKKESGWNKEKEEAFGRAWAKMIAKAWSDPTYKEKLLKNPRAVFKEQGIEFPSGIDCKINESTDKIVYLNLPKKPPGEISEEQLRKVVGGAAGGAAGFCTITPG